MFLVKNVLRRPANHKYICIVLSELPILPSGTIKGSVEMFVLFNPRVHLSRNTVSPVFIFRLTLPCVTIHLSLETHNEILAMSYG